MKYSINFERHYKNEKFDYMFWHDNNIFKTYKEALEHAMNMVEKWRQNDKELITFNIISH